MSRSQNTENPNPAKRFFEWNGSSGGFRYYDKEKEERIAVALPFRFMVLDCLSTVKGFKKAEDSGYWSNEVRDITKDILTVRTKSGQCASGTWSQIKSNVSNCNGVKYCQSVYIAFKESDGTMSICNVQMLGAALGSWIEFRKKNKVFDGAIAVESFVEGVNGATKYQIPIFKKLEATESSNNIALALDKELQEYFKIYFAKTGQEIADKHIEDVVPDNSFSDDVDAALNMYAPQTDEEKEESRLPF